MYEPPLLILAALLLLIGAANSAPIAVKNWLGKRFARPLDRGLRLADDQRLFGASKTLRGVLAGALTPALIAPALGWPAWQGLAIGAAAMAGDLISSFTKRRMKLPPSSQSRGLDQVPESLLPALVAMAWFDLRVWDVLLLVAAFVFLSLTVSKVLYRYNLRDKPY